MIYVKTPLMTLPVAVLAIGLSMAAPAFSAEEAAPAPGAASEKAVSGEKGKPHVHRKHVRKGPGFASPEELDKLQAMSPEERKAYFEEKRKKWQGMSEEERKAELEKRKAAYEALSPEEKEKLKARHAALREKMKEERKAYLDNLSPEEKEAYMKRIREKKAQFGDKFKDKTPEEREAFKKRMMERKGSGPGKDVRKPEAKPAE